MIGKLKGKVEDLKPTEVIIDVHGVGFELTIPFSTYEKIQGEKHATLLVHTIHKEDQFRLFGFHSKIERDIFKSLIAVSGIGPSMAISLLSGMTPENLIDSVKNQNIAALTKIPGIGKTKAEKLIFELKKDYTIVIVTHNMQQASRVSDFTGFFLLGDLVEFDETKIIFTNPKDSKTESYITGRFG